MLKKYAKGEKPENKIRVLIIERRFFMENTKETTDISVNQQTPQTDNLNSEDNVISNKPTPETMF